MTLGRTRATLECKPTSATQVAGTNELVALLGSGPCGVVTWRSHVVLQYSFNIFISLFCLWSHRYALLYGMLSLLHDSVRQVCMTAGKYAVYCMIFRRASFTTLAHLDHSKATTTALLSQLSILGDAVDANMSSMVQQRPCCRYHSKTTDFGKQARPQNNRNAIT
jgi:hypothetical protein